MSKEAVIEFTEKVSADQALQTEVEEAIAGKEGSEAASTVVALGAKHGYTFTPEELKAQQEELSDEDLEDVAGGGGLNIAAGEA